jgi:hypothetical protein
MSGRLRQRFLKATYLAEKKRLWQKRDLRWNEDMANHFDAKVDLRAFVFEEDPPDSQLILDLLDGLPAHMPPTLKASIRPFTTLLDLRRILLNCEKGLRWDVDDERSDDGSNDSESCNDDIHPGIEHSRDKNSIDEGSDDGGGSDSMGPEI